MRNVVFGFCDDEKVVCGEDFEFFTFVLFVVLDDELAGSSEREERFNTSFRVMYGSSSLSL